MKASLFFILLVLTLNIASATDTLTFENCENLGINECEGFRQLDLTADEQKKLFSSLLEIKDNSNIHDFIFDWNTNLDFDEIPYTVLPQYYKTIEDAWLIVTSIMPSVLYGNALYNNYSGSVQTNYDYELTRPETYFNGYWSVCGSGSTNELDDCRTEYPNNWDESYLNVYLNSNLIGNTTLASFNTTDSQNSFESVLNIVNKIERQHYKWQQGDCCECRHCCWRSGGRTRCGRDCDRCGCETHRQNCEASHTDFRYDELVLTDNKTSFLEQTSYSKPAILFDKAKSMAYFSVNTTNIDHYNLNIDELEIIKTNLVYNHEYDYLPVNVLIAKAEDSPEINANVYSIFISQDNSDLISFYLRKDNFSDCNLDLYSYFNTFNLSCNVAILPLTELNITTDKFFYMPNETIKVNISIKSNANTQDDIIKVRYGNHSVNVTGSNIIEIPTQLNVNQIKAEYETDFTHQSASAVKTISVYAGENPAYYTTIFWIIIAFLCFISALRMCWIKFFSKKEVVLGDN